jgi:type VI secretion system (T6SS) phospholipase Tle1-like effector
MFIAQNYLPGDELFLFGFSRGAYTARSHGITVRESSQREFCNTIEGGRTQQHVSFLPNGRRPRATAMLSTPVSLVRIDCKRTEELGRGAQLRSK